MGSSPHAIWNKAVKGGPSWLPSSGWTSHEYLFHYSWNYTDTLICAHICVYMYTHIYTHMHKFLNWEKKKQCTKQQAKMLAGLKTAHTHRTVSPPLDEELQGLMAELLMAGLCVSSGGHSTLCGHPVRKTKEGWERGSRGRGYMYTYNWFTMLYSRN